MKYLQTVRHGDMVLFKLNPEFTKLEEKKSRTVEKVVVGLGEVTGHSHDVICDETATLKVYSSNDKNINEMTADEIATMENLIFEVIGGNAVITHDEHDIIKLDEGLWLRSFQVEFNPFKEMVDKVRD
jgi:hypothetical protein